MPHRINIKPLSINKCWQGRRFKTKAYEAYEEEVLYSLPRLSIGPHKLVLSLTVAFSNKASDIDNVIKPFLDILQKKYGFNDKQVYRLIVEKKDVKKGEEYIEFLISKYKPLT